MPCLSAHEYTDADMWVMSDCRLSAYAAKILVSSRVCAVVQAIHLTPNEKKMIPERIYESAYMYILTNDRRRKVVQQKVTHIPTITPSFCLSLTLSGGHCTRVDMPLNMRSDMQLPNIQNVHVRTMHRLYADLMISVAIET